jgi:hypothetical protein
MFFIYFILFHISANRILLSSVADIERLVLSDAFARLWANIGRRDRTHLVKLNQYCGYSVSVTEWHVKNQASKQTSIDRWRCNLRYPSSRTFPFPS